MEKPWYSFLYINSPITKIVWGIVSTLVAIVVLLMLLIMEPSRMAAQASSWQGRSIEKGADIWANNCYTCHGDHGQGGAGPALNSKHFFTQRLTELGFTGTLPDFIKLTVSAGRPSLVHAQFSVVMPTWSNRFGGPLRDDQVQNVTDYVMNWMPTAELQTDAEDPFIHFNNIPVSTTVTVSGTATVSGTGSISGTATISATAPAGPRSPETLFMTTPPGGMGCIACHNPNLPEDADNRGLVGPNLGNIADHAGSRVPGQDASTYVHNSIMTPGAFTVDGYPAGVMPQDFASRMTPVELNNLVNWLLDPGREKH